MNEQKLKALRGIFSESLSAYEEALALEEDGSIDESYCYDMAEVWVTQSLSSGDYLSILEILSS